jgi:hypothetical protein
MSYSKKDLKNLILEKLEQYVGTDTDRTCKVDSLLDYVDEDDLVIVGYTGGFAEVERSVKDPEVVLNTLRDDAVARVADRLGIR